TNRNSIIAAYPAPAISEPATTTPAQCEAPGRVLSAPENRPIIRFVGDLKYVPIFSTTEDTSDVVLQDLCFDSKYNHNTEKTGMPDCLKPAGANTTVRNCLFLNIGYGINCNEQPRGVMGIDNSCPLETGLRSYFAWVQGAD